MVLFSPPSNSLNLGIDPGKLDVPKTEFTKLGKSESQKEGKFNPDALKNVYSIWPESWYKVFPYVFAIETLEGTTKRTFRYALPIPPESIVTQLISPSEAVPTLGGVVEEPSATVFWSIQLAGTMGIAPSRSDDPGRAQEVDTLKNTASAFRTTISKTGLLSGMVSSLLKPLDSVNNMAMSFAQNGFLSGLNSVLQPQLPYSESAVSGKSNGYVEIHNFHRFLIFYTHLNSRKDAFSDDLVKEYGDSKYGLFFYNYKDNQKFRIVLKNFMVMKTQNSPFLYRYQCQFKGWSLSSADSEPGKGAIDRFKGDLKSVNTVTITSALTRAKGLLRTFKSATTDPLGTFISTPPVI